MTDNNFETLIKAFKEVQMTPDEKRGVFKQTMLVIEKIEAVSLAHSDLHKATRPTSPVGTDGIIEATNSQSHMFAIPGDHILHDNSHGNNRGFRRIASTWVSYVRQRRFIPALAAAFILVFTGGASMLADSALPGDSLYSLKVNVNEPIRDLTAVGKEAKARLAVEVTERRLQEAAVLSAQGKLDDSNKKIIQDQFSKRASQIRNQVASLVSENNLDAAQEIVVDFESALQTHELVLSKLDSNPVIVVASGTDPVATSTATSSPNTPNPGNASSTPGSSVGAGVAANTLSGNASSTPNNSLLVAVKAELDTTKTARIGIEQQANARIVQNLNQSPNTAQLVIDARIKDLNFTIADIETELKNFDYASNTVQFARKRLDNASSSIKRIADLSKAGQITEAHNEIRLVAKDLSEVLVLLKIEKSTRGSLGDNKLDVTSIIQGDMASSTPANGQGANASSTPQASASGTPANNSASGVLPNSNTVTI